MGKRSAALLVAAVVGYCGFSCPAAAQTAQTSSFSQRDATAAALSFCDVQVTVGLSITHHPCHVFEAMGVDGLPHAVKVGSDGSLTITDATAHADAGAALTQLLATATNTAPGAPITGATMPSGGAGPLGWLSSIWSRLGSPLQASDTNNAPYSSRAAITVGGASVAATRGTHFDNCTVGGTVIVTMAGGGTMNVTIGAAPFVDTNYSITGVPSSGATCANYYGVY